MNSDNDLLEEYIEEKIKEEFANKTPLMYRLCDEDGEPITSRPALITEDSPALKKWYDSINHTVNVHKLPSNGPVDKCDCGAEKARTFHSHWCSSGKGEK